MPQFAVWNFMNLAEPLCNISVKNEFFSFEIKISRFVGNHICDFITLCFTFCNNVKLRLGAFKCAI